MEERMDETARDMKHSDLLYDYIKFHLGLYLATPTVLAVIATALDVTKHDYFKAGMIGLIGIYFLAGIHASWTVARHINVEWSTDETWRRFGKTAGVLRRRLVHHYLYWFGLICGLGGILYAWLS
jgi:hypothetical protein